VGDYTKTTASGTPVTDSLIVLSGTNNRARTVDGWYSASCSGFRPINAYNVALLDITIGSKVKYRGGFRYMADTSSSTPVFAEHAREDLTYVIAENALNLMMGATTAATLLFAAF
jgi:hypothetical protein